MITKTVLVVDDDIPTARALARMLKIHGYSASTANNVTRALDALAAGGFSAVLCDGKLGQQLGTEVLDYARRQRPGQAFVFLTASPHLVAAEASAAGVEVLEKPASNDAILAALTRALARSDASEREG